MATEFFTKGAISYAEYKQQCVSLRLFAFGAVSLGCVTALFVDPPKSSYWATWSPFSWASYIKGGFSNDAPPLFLTQKSDSTSEVKRMVAKHTSGQEHGGLFTAAPAKKAAKVIDASSLWARMGGESQIRPLCNDLYDMHSTDPLTAPWFGKDTGKNIRTADEVKENVFTFFSAGIGGPHEYKGNDMKKTHANMKIDKHAFHALTNHVLVAMEKHKTGGRAEREEVYDILMSLQADVMHGTESKATEVAKPTESLWDRMGGEEQIRPLCNELYEMHSTDPLTAPWFGIKVPGNIRTAEAVKENVFTFFSAGIGGPHAYKGNDMKTVHAHMKIDRHAFHALTNHVLVAMEKHKTGGPAEREEVHAILMSLRPDVMHGTEGKSKEATPEAPAAAAAADAVPAGDKACSICAFKALQERCAICAGESKHAAFVFIKPHAVTDQVKFMLNCKLKNNGITVISEGDIAAEKIDKDQLIDTHYGAIAAKAMKVKPDALTVQPKAQEAFETAFGLKWAEALAQGKVYNASDAAAKLGLSGDELGAKFGKLKSGVNLLKFGGGFYCGEIDGLYVINGFYMNMRTKFTTPGTGIHYYEVEWDSKKLSWADFRGQVLGGTDPKTAHADSARHLIYENWESLGLKTLPNTSDNGVHASASPFEALSERCNWLGASISEDFYGKALLARGVPLKVLMAWTEDPPVNFEGKKQSLFDLLEDLDSPDCLRKSRQIAHAN